jgi:hypothetical protein
MYSTITNPITGRTVSVRGTAGKNILRNYVVALSNILKGGSESSARAPWTEDAREGLTALGVDATVVSATGAASLAQNLDFDARLTPSERRRRGARRRAERVRLAALRRAARRSLAVEMGLMPSSMTAQEWANFEIETVEAELRRRGLHPSWISSVGSDLEDDTIRAEIQRRGAVRSSIATQRAPAAVLRRSDEAIRHSGQEEPSLIPIARIVSDGDQLATAVAVPEALTCVPTNKLRADKAARADCFERLKLSEAALADCSEKLTLSKAAVRRAGGITTWLSTPSRPPPLPPRKGGGEGS